MKHALLTVVKALFSLALVVYLLSRLDIRHVGQAMATLHPAAFAISAAFLLSALVLAARRWRLFIPYEISFPRITSLCFVGAFFNTCLPGVVGGDVVKAYYLGRELKGRQGPDDANRSAASVSAGSVFMDHIMGMAILLAMALLIYPWALAYIKGTPALWLVPVLLVAFPLCLVLLIRMKVGRRFPLVREFHDYLRASLGEKRVLLKALLYSFVVQLLSITSVSVIACGLSLHVSPITFFVFIPLINILLLVPVSISGIGLREGAFAFFFGTVGVPVEKAVALSFLWFLSQITASLPGLYCYVRNRGSA